MLISSQDGSLQSLVHESTNLKRTVTFPRSFSKSRRLSFTVSFGSRLPYFVAFVVEIMDRCRVFLDVV